MFSSWHYPWYALVFQVPLWDDYNSAFLVYDVHLIALSLL